MYAYTKGILRYFSGLVTQLVNGETGGAYEKSTDWVSKCRPFYALLVGFPVLLLYCTHASLRACEEKHVTLCIGARYPILFHGFLYRIDRDWTDTSLSSYDEYVRYNGVEEGAVFFA